ncbi:MAG: amidohydrolase [Pseudomonadota bacterium]|nr:amidohydrolase [Pseudomonadota bacterium]
MNDQQIAAIRAQWAKVRGDVVRHMRLMWEQPELPNMETFAAGRLADWLEDSGFDLERGACGLPTAFIARWSQGDGPRVALLLEYDALPGTDNAAVSRREARGQRAGHACGHNQIGAANAGAAIAAKAAMAELGVGGEIVVLGCPAEEIVWGKVAMFSRGAFHGIDAILTSHGDGRNGAASMPCKAVWSSEFVFMGEAGHGGSPPKNNALDAAELAVQSLERLRAHHFADTSVEHVLRVGGHMPSVTPDEARVWLVVRHEDFDRAGEVYRFAADIFRRASDSVGTSIREQFIASTRGYLPNHALGRALQRNLEVVGPPQWSADDLAWMEALCGAIRPGGGFTLDRDLAFHTEGVDPYGQDDGEASWRIPLARVNWAAPDQIPYHNWAYTALTGHGAGDAGPLMASQGLALATVDLCADPAVIHEAKAELAERVGGATLAAAPYGAFETLTRDPASFWDSTWTEKTSFDQ